MASAILPGKPIREGLGSEDLVLEFERMTSSEGRLCVALAHGLLKGETELFLAEE